MIHFFGWWLSYTGLSMLAQAEVALPGTQWCAAALNGLLVGYAAILFADDMTRGA